MNQKQIEFVNEMIKVHGQKSKELLSLGKKCYDRGEEQQAISYQCEGFTHDDIVIELKHLLEIEGD